MIEPTAHSPSTRIFYSSPAPEGGLSLTPRFSGMHVAVSSAGTVSTVSQIVPKVLKLKQFEPHWTFSTPLKRGANEIKAQRLQATVRWFTPLALQPLPIP